MADVKISGLPASTTPLAGTEVLPIVQGGQTRQVSVANLTAGRAVSATDLTFTGTASGPTYETNNLTTGATLTNNSLSADGTDTNIDLLANPKGTGGFGINGAPTGVVAGVGFTSKFCVKNEDSSAIGGFVQANNTTATAGSGIFACRSRGTLAAPTVVQSGDNLASLFFLGNDGTDLAIAAVMQVDVDGTPGNNDMPGRIVFKTTPDGSEIPVEAMRITSAQNVTLATGNLVIGTSGKGIDFSATPGTGTSELLNDYEEGDWTPNLLVGATGSSGTYTKIGRQVTVRGTLTGASISFGASAIICDNLPFNVVAGSNFAGAVIADLNGAFVRANSQYVIATTTLTPAVTAVTFTVTYFVV